MPTTTAPAPKPTAPKAAPKPRAPRTPAKTGNPPADRAKNAAAAKPAPAAAAPAPAAAPAKGKALEYVLVNGDFRVHRAGCSDLKADLKKSDYEAPGTMTAETEREAILDLWDDQIRESAEDADAPTDDELGQYVGATDFLACCKLKSGSPKVNKTNAKMELARKVAQAIADLGLSDDEQAIAANWTHHLPTGKTEAGARWWPEDLVRPDRSDW